MHILSPFIRTRIVLLLVSLILGMMSGCGTSAKRGALSGNSDLSKIMVEPFGHYDRDSSPAQQAAEKLTDKIIGQLGQENRLQVEIGTDSPTLYGVILSYQDATLDVQAELYDGGEYLAFSRVRRHVDQNEDMKPSLDLIAQQLLDELMGKMRDQQNSQQYFRADTSNSQTSDANLDSYYSRWGWWRHRHDNLGSPEPQRHWDSDGQVDALPRSTRVIGYIEQKRTELENSVDPQGKKTSALLTGLGIVAMILLFVLAAAFGSGNSHHDSDRDNCHEYHGSEHCRH